MTRNVISPAKLGKLSGLTPRRIQQLVVEGVLPESQARGQLNRDESLTKLFAYFRGRSGEYAVERLALLKAKRQLAESKVAALGGDAIPIDIVNQGLQQVGFRLNRLVSSDIYGATGLKPTEETKRVVDLAGLEAVQDCETYLQQWLNRQAQIQHEKQKAQGE